MHFNVKMHFSQSNSGDRWYEKRFALIYKPGAKPKDCSLHFFDFAGFIVLIILFPFDGFRKLSNLKL